MQELIQDLEKNGFKLPEIRLDGTIVRFGLKKRQWFIGWQHHTSKGGEEYIIAIYGDWAEPGKEYEFKSGGSLRREDRLILDKKAAEMRKRREEEEKRIHEEVAKESEEEWETYKDQGVSPYLEAKHIPYNFDYGIRFGVGQVKVPCRDIDGKIWGIQTINAGSGKYFKTGQRKKGTFHVIGGLGTLAQQDKLFVCEGFATGASLYLALARPVIVSFDSGNLLGVVRVLRSKYPTSEIIICGDDDQFKDTNSGRTSAEAAAVACFGASIFPTFKDLKTEPTDFNDLHILEGLEAVKRQVLKVKSDPKYIIPLGYNDGKYFFISDMNQQIQTVRVNSFGKNNLLAMQPLIYWESNYDTGKGGIAWDKAVSDLMEKATKAGVFHEDNVRGRGVWLDNGKIVVHHGNRLFYDGAEHSLHKNNLRSSYFYAMQRTMPALHPEPLTVQECEAILEPLQFVHFKVKEQYMLLAGWIAIAPLCGILPWRPHLWLTGPSGSGKSTLVEQFIKVLLQPFSEFVLGNTTEAGIRQQTGSNARPVLFEELETNDERSGERIGFIVELAKLASSSTNARILKGTANGEPISFKPEFCLFGTSIRPNLKNEEYRNRFFMCDLDRLPSTAKMEDFENILAKIDVNMAHRLFARMVKMAPVLLENIKVCQKIFTKAYTARFAQQYGAMIAGYYCLIQGQPMTEHDAQLQVQLHTASLIEGDLKNDQPDEINCLNTIMEHRILVDGQLIPIQEMVMHAKRGDALFNAILQRQGIVVEDEFICIANQFGPLKTIFEKTKWQGGYSKILARIPGVTKTSYPKDFTQLGRQYRCTFVPFVAIKS